MNLLWAKYDRNSLTLLIKEPNSEGVKVAAKAKGAFLKQNFNAIKHILVAQRYLYFVIVEAKISSSWNVSTNRSAACKRFHPHP